MRTKLHRQHLGQISPFLLQPGDVLYNAIAGQRWSSFFHNDHPITVELACGRGEYTTGLAKVFPRHNFIGVDIKGDRLGHGLQDQQRDHLTNVGFLRTIIHHLTHFFHPGEVDELRLVHPDPRPKLHDARRRLSHPRFLSLYRQILKSDWLLHFKTDDHDLYHFTLQSLTNSWRTIIAQTNDLYASPLLAYHHHIVTHYESLGLIAWSTICYLQAKMI